MTHSSASDNGLERDVLSGVLESRRGDVNVDYSACDVPPVGLTRYNTRIFGRLVATNTRLLYYSSKVLNVITSFNKHA
jgi:hypothetical protein